MKAAIRIFALLSILNNPVKAQVNYPYPLHSIHLKIEKQDVKMAYMDVSADHPNGKAVILFHGKNFNGYYWKDVIKVLTDKGYRVIAPDQVGWGRSDKPNLHYSFQMLADNNRKLLDSLHIKSVTVIGHSMGGMLATRFTLMYPGMVEKLVLENPIGLEDYKTFVPYTPIDSLFTSEMKATYDSYKKYQQSYYPQWQPEYEQYVKAQAEPLYKPGFRKTAWANALTYEMIYEQPVVYEFKNINVPTLLVIGQADRTIVGKNLLSDVQKNEHGKYPELGRQTHDLIKNSKLVEIEGTGHIPHIQKFNEFAKALFDFLQ